MEHLNLHDLLSQQMIKLILYQNHLLFIIINSFILHPLSINPNSSPPPRKMNLFKHNKSYRYHIFNSTHQIF